MKDSVSEEAAKILEGHIAQLMEHFDSVVILATRPTHVDGVAYHDATVRCGGSFYANYGLGKEWVIEQEHRIRLDAERKYREADAEAEET